MWMADELWRTMAEPEFQWRLRKLVETLVEMVREDNGEVLRANRANKRHRLE